MALKKIGQGYELRWNTTTQQYHIVQSNGDGTESDLGAVVSATSTLDTGGTAIDPSTSGLQTAGNDILTTIDVDTNNISTYTNQGRDYMLEVAMGNIPGKSHINKFGHNALATAGDDVWSGGGVYAFYPTTAQTIEIVSDSVEDDVLTAGAIAGTGAWTVKVFGLDGDFNEVNETVSLNGLGVVALTENTYIRLYRASVLTAGTAGTNVGNIAVRVQGGGDTGAYIAAGDGQTQQAIYTIPAGKSGYFIKGYTALKNSTFQGEDGSFQWLLRPNNGSTGAWAVQGQIGLVNVGNSWWQYEYGIPAGPLPAMTDIRIKLSAASDTMDTVAGFDILLVDD